MISYAGRASDRYLTKHDYVRANASVINGVSYCRLNGSLRYLASELAPMHQMVVAIPIHESLVNEGRRLPSAAWLAAKMNVKNYS